MELFCKSTFDAKTGVLIKDVWCNTLILRSAAGIELIRDAVLVAKKGYGENIGKLSMF